MDFELKLEKPKISRAWISAATMGLSCFLSDFYLQLPYGKGLYEGSIIPIFLYFNKQNVTNALFIYIGTTVIVLLRVIGLLFKRNDLDDLGYLR